MIKVLIGLLIFIGLSYLLTIFVLLGEFRKYKREIEHMYTLLNDSCSDIWDSIYDLRMEINEVKKDE